jgi:archaellum component FlaC
LLAEQYDRIMAEQEAADEAATLARQTEIDNLRDLLREELATSEDAALSQRSDITKALEGRISDLQSDIDAETQGLRQAGLDERAALARQIEEGDRLVREAQEASVGSLQERIGSLSGDLSDINAAIDANYNLLDQAQQNAADATQAEITGLNNQLESLYADVESGKAVDTATGERAALASRIDALQAAGLTQDDLAAAINPIAQQRQEAISAAVNPIQEQIAALRQEIPQQVDTEALRQQIKDEIMASLPQQQTTPAVTTGAAEGQQGVSVEPEGDVYADLGPSSSEAAGFNPAVTANVSDGQADAMGLFDDPRPMQQFNRTPGVRDTVAVPVMRGNQMTGRTGPFIPDMRDIMQGVNVRGAGL